MKRLEVDVAVIGGGLAGNLLVRQLRRTLPDLNVALFEKATERSSKVGESTVEIGSHYLLKLGLSRYLYHRHLPQNGLRFFFDTPDKNAPLETMSEIGSLALPFIPSFQLERARLETDLMEMNRADGAEILVGAKVSRVQVSEGDRHSFEVRQGDDKTEVSCRWLIDASGRAQLLSRAMDLRVEDEHGLAAVWGWFEDVADFDDIGSDAFRARIRHTSRVLSTNHFCYPGYWIWFIPLASGVTSVGLVMDKAQWRDELRQRDGFLSFLREHAAPASLLEKAKLNDIQSYGHLTYGTKTFYSPHRWGLVGEASAFTDPFYSPGTDFIALGNDFVCDLIGREHGGEDIGERAEAYDAFMQFRYETTMLIYRDLYRLLGSYELFNLKWDFDIGCYYNLWVEPYMRGEHLDLDFLRGQLRQRKLVLGVMERFSELFRKLTAELESKGEYHRMNLGSYQGVFPTMDCAVELGTDESAKGALRRTAEAFNFARRRALELLGEDAALEARPTLPMSHFLAGKPLTG